MARTKSKASDISSEVKRTRRIAPATTPEGREKQLIALATSLVEERLRNGTATSQEICTVLRMGTMRERLEREKIEEDLKLTRAKTEALESAKHVEELYSKAIDAMKKYSGLEDSQGATDD